MAVKDEVEITPANIYKQMKQLKVKWDGEIIYLQKAINAYNRKRLIQHKIPFVVPGNQMYLPMIGIDLREYFKKINSGNIKVSPSSQVVILNALLKDEVFTYTPTKLARKLGYTVMTFARAFNQLETLGIGEVKEQGRERTLRFENDKKALWEKSLAYMQSPVIKRVCVQALPKDISLLKGGLTALAYFSNLVEPKQDVYALCEKKWKTIKDSTDILELPSSEPEAIELEIWSYSPDMFAENNMADRFSLYLSLRGIVDERIEFALDEMMEKIIW